MTSPTGRLSTGVPALQRLRQEHDAEQQVRRLVEAFCEDKEPTLVHADYGQIERRILANMNKGDPHD